MTSIAVAERVTAAGVGILLMGLAVWLGVRAVRRGDQPVEPLAVFVLVWGFALVLFAVPWIRYTETSTRTWVAIYGSIAAFSLACVAVYRFAPSRLRDTTSSETLVPARVRLVWVGSLVLGLIGFAAYVRAVEAVLGLDTALANPSLVRDIQTTSPKFDALYGHWRLLIYFNQIALLVWTIGLRAGAFRGRWRLAVPLGLIAAVPFVFTGERTLLATGVVWIVFFHLLWKPVRRWRRAIAGALTVAVLLAAGFLVIGARQSKTIDVHPEIVATLTSKTLSSAALEYLYVTGNVPTLSQLMKAPEAPRTHGQMTLLPGVKLTHALTGIGGEPPEEVGAFYPIPFETFNNYTWLGTFYLDFGLVGCLLLPALFGIVAGLCAIWARSRRSLLSAWSLSLVLYVTAFTPLLNKLSTTLTWQYFLIGPVVMLLVLEREGTARRFQRPEWLKRRGGRLRVGLPGAVALLLLLAVTAFGTDNPPASTTAADLERHLQDAAGRVRAVYAEHGALPASYTLSSQLHVADPATRYSALADYADRPAAGTIGIYASGTEAWLWGEPPDGELRGVRLVLAGSRRGTYLQRLPAVVAPAPNTPRSALRRGEANNLLRNGDLEDPLGRAWQISVGRNARIRNDLDFSWASNGSLRLGGLRRTAPTGAFVTQVVRRLPRRSIGSIYTFRMHSYAPDISRPLTAAMKFNYVDGSSEFFAAHRGSSGGGKGPRADAVTDFDNGQWNLATAVGGARKPLKSIQVLLFDTGTEPLSGKAWIDGVSLVVGDVPVRFPSPR